MKRLILILAILAGPALADTPKVLTDIAPVHSLVALVMGDLGEPTLLLNPNDDVHHMQLRPSQARALTRADVLFWIGPDLEPWLNESLSDLNTTAVSVPLGTDGVANEHQEDSHADEHAHGIHPWLDPVEASEWLHIIADTLGELDPANQDTYVAHAILAQAELAALKARINSELAPLSPAGFVVSHDAYDGFARQFGLTIVATLRDSEASEPGAARIAGIRDMVTAGQVACVFNDAGHSAALLQTVTQGTDVATGELDAIGINLTPGPGLYGELLGNIAGAFADCR